MMKNKFGLDRNIPSPIARKIRQKCGFGCVVCGNAICEYEHIEPEFVDAKYHDPDKIALLCGSCHANVTKGLWSKQKILDARNNPYCLETGNSTFCLECRGNDLYVEILDCVFINTRDLLQVYGKNLISIIEPEQNGAPPRLNALFYDRKGNRIAQINDNVWKGDSSAFDIETAGSSILIRSDMHQIDLRFHIVGPDRIAIDRMSLFYKGVTVDCDGKKLSANGMRTGITIYRGLANTTSRYRTGIAIDDTGIRLGSESRFGPKYLGVPIPTTIGIVGCHIEIMRTIDAPEDAGRPPNSKDDDPLYKFITSDGRYFYFVDSQIEIS